MKVFGIWLGPKQLSETAEHCLETWPDDADLIRGRARLASLVPWIRDIRYFEDAYAANQFAGASDVARLAMLYEFGGCYLDVDVEIISKQALAALDDGRFHIGLEDGQNVCGAVMVAPPKHPFVAHMLDVYRSTNFKDTFNGKCNGTTLLTKAAGRWEGTDVVVHDKRAFYPWHWSHNPDALERMQLIESQPGIITDHHWSHQWEQTNL